MIIDYLNVDPQLIKNGERQHKDTTGRSQENLGSQNSQRSQKSQNITKSQKVCTTNNSVQRDRNIILDILNLMLPQMKTGCTES